MTEIIPAVLAKNFTDLNEKISHYVNVSKLVQIDVCDGNFVSSVSWPFDKLRVNQNDPNLTSILNEEKGMPSWDKVDFEFDLMVSNAIDQFEFFTRLGAKRIIFHLEAEDKQKLKEFLEGIDPYIKENLGIGIAINNRTEIGELSPFINLIDFVQCMGIDKIGYQGQEFDEKVIEQIKNLRSKYPELIISIDGGVNENTAGALVKAGANRLVIGSALEESFNLYDSIKYFESL